MFTGWVADIIGPWEGMKVADDPAATHDPTHTATTSSDVRGQIFAACARVVIATGLLLVVYFQVPIGRDTTATSLAWFGLALVGFGIALGFQVRRIINDPVPRLRAAETLGAAIPLFIVLFALVYVSLASVDPANFTQPVSRLSALYFTVTVLTTTGFGDITARTDAARTVVTVQMLLDLVLIGVVVRIVIGASRIGIERRRAEAQAEPGGSTRAGD
jgi:voltage-gated potassium channel